MTSTRSQRLRGSLGDSWGEADYESSDADSIQSASDVVSELLSGSDMEDDDVDATPVATTRIRIAPTKARQSPQFATPVKTRPLRSSRTNTPVEPSFIMPSMHASPSLHGSTRHSPTMRVKPRARQPRPQTYGAKSSQSESRRTSKQAPPKSPQRAKPRPESDTYLQVFWKHVAWPVLRYVEGVVGVAMSYLQPLFGLALALLVISTVLGNASLFLQYRVQQALSPICYIPLSSYVLPFCARPARPRDAEPLDVDFEELMKVQNNIEDIINQSHDAAVLPHTMKESELTIRDLRAVVKHSRLPSKNELDLEFGNFIEAARQAASDLIKYNSNINAAVDRVINTNKWTRQVLTGLSEKEEGVGKLERLLESINPLSAFSARPLTLQEAVHQQYIKHAGANKDEIDKLIQRGLALQSLLNSLEDQLGTIANIAARDDDKISQNRDELLAQLWTRLGANGKKMKDYEKKLKILRNVRVRHNEAFRQVSGVLLKLQTISAGLGDLRDTVSEPFVLGYRSEIPIERYLELVDQSTNRLQEARGQAGRIQGQVYNAAMGNEQVDTDKGLPSGKEGPVVYAKNKEGRKN